MCLSNLPLVPLLWWVIQIRNYYLYEIIEGEWDEGMGAFGAFGAFGALGPDGGQRGTLGQENQNN